MKLQQEDFVNLYSLFCDVVERAWQRWPVDSYKDDPFGHTSSYARAAANRIMEALNEIEVDE
jgi:hypothetical protein